MKKMLLIIAALLIFPAYGGQLSAEQRSQIGQLPVQYQGRIQPIAVFAENMLLQFANSRSIANQAAVDWLLQTLFQPEQQYSIPLFAIRNPNVATWLRLPERNPPLYSFIEISTNAQLLQPTLNAIQKKPLSQRSIIENQLWELYSATLLFFDLSRTLSALLPTLVVTDDELAQTLNIQPQQQYSYIQLNRRTAAIQPNRLAASTRKSLNQLQAQLDTLANDALSQTMRLIPTATDSWLSPWQIIQSGAGSPMVAKYISSWQQFAAAYLDNNQQDMRQSSAALLATSTTDFARMYSTLRIVLEYWQLRTSPFTWLTAGYAILACAWLWVVIRRLNSNHRLLFAATWLTIAAHAAAIAVRVYIVNRPPVATLYESIIAAGMVAAVFAVLLEQQQYNSTFVGTPALAGTLIAATLLWLSHGYAAAGDTMGVLVAVLNSNFWLTTHVICVILGYGCGLLASILAHIYLLRRCFIAHQRILQHYNAAMVIGLFALFFISFGTILGGIWADQSWGRFWGWDPKENGALAISLWLLITFHSKWAAAKPLTVATCMAVTAVVIMLAWFGVNLLNTGLHSYGFTQNIAANLILFIGAEALLLSTIHGWIHTRKCAG